MSHREFGVFILGAGFSRPAGLPLGSQLFAEIRSEALRMRKYPHLERDLQRFIAFQERVNGVCMTEDNVDLEDFMSFLDIEHFLGLKGKDTWSSVGNESQIAIRVLITRVLYDCQQRIDPVSWDIYEQFVDRLQPGDIVVTFNYDTILETALERKDIPYRLVQEAHCDEIGVPADEIPEDPDVMVLKMHGSIDWFDIQPFHDACGSRATQERYQHPRHAVFTDYKTFWPKRIAGRYYDDSLLSGIYRVSTLEEWFEHPDRGLFTPLILSPSFSKVLYMNPLRDLWYGFYSVGSSHGRLAIIGFSLPAHDEYLRQPLANAITRFQSDDTHVPPDEKSTLKIVDRRLTPEQVTDLKRNYSFVDWEDTDTYFDGFDGKAIDMIFAGRRRGDASTSPA